MKRNNDHIPGEALNRLWRFRLAALLLSALALVLSAGPAAAEDATPDYRVVVYAPLVSHYTQNHIYARLFKDDLEKRWPGRQVELRFFPREILNDPGEVSRTLAALADDPLIRGLVLEEAPAGSIDGLARMRAKRPDIYAIAIDPHEKMERMAKVATLTLALNHPAQGFLYPTLARRMGARTVVYFSFPRHMAQPQFSQQYRVISQAARDLDMILVSDLTCPDSLEPGHDPGLLEKYLEKAVRAYLEQYGPKTAFVASGAAHSDMLVPIIMREGGIMLPAVQPSLLLGYPQALDMVEEAGGLFGQWPKLLGVIDEKIMALRPAAEFAAWVCPHPHTAMLAMTDLTVDAIENQSDLYKRENIERALAKYSPGIKWLVNTQMDYLNDRPVPQALVLIQDTYWFGHGYQGFTRLNIPAKYYRIK